TEDFLLFHLGDATAYPDHKIRAANLQWSENPESCEHLLRGLLPHGAGVEQNHIRFGVRARGRHSLRGEDSGHPLGVMLVHLAAPGLDPVPQGAIRAGISLRRRPGRADGFDAQARAFPPAPSLSWNAFRSRSLVARRSSGMTRVPAMTVMKFVSPAQRG